MGVVFPVDVFKKIGLVDNINFPQYYGDADFTLRAKKMVSKFIATTN